MQRVSMLPAEIGPLYNCLQLCCCPLPSLWELPAVVLRLPCALLLGIALRLSPIHPPVHNVCRYRRLDLWLPHGLASTTTIDALASRIKLCGVRAPQLATSGCTRLNFTLTLPKPGLARMDVPGMLPHQMYRVSVKASNSVRDGFGLPLTASNQTFWSVDTDAYFTGPTLRYGSTVLQQQQAQRVYLEWG